jgi:hypothetical protein
MKKNLMVLLLKELLSIPIFMAGVLCAKLDSLKRLKR